MGTTWLGPTAADPRLLEPGLYWPSIDLLDRGIQIKVPAVVFWASLF